MRSKHYLSLVVTVAKISTPPISLILAHIKSWILVTLIRKKSIFAFVKYLRFLEKIDFFKKAILNVSRDRLLCSPLSLKLYKTKKFVIPIAKTKPEKSANVYMHKIQFKKKANQFYFYCSLPHVHYHNLKQRKIKIK